MKGIVFTEFLEMVETVFGDDMADDILDDADLESGGAFTAVGTYDYQEMVALVTELSKRTEIAIPDLLKTYGKHLFGRFYTLFPTFFEGIDNSIDFAQTIENHIHIEVRKLYSDAELPSFDTERDDNSMSMVYRSARPFADFAEGLLTGCIEHYNQDATLTRHDIADDNTHTQFVLTRKVTDPA
ncbi:MAG: heme NO-binding domain-containing protein [Candidatus Promineifilaceae bacterium]